MFFVLVFCLALCSCSSSSSPPAQRSWGTAVTIENNGGNAFHPQIAIDSAGNAIAVWHQMDSTLGYYKIWSSRYTAATGWGMPTMIGNNAGNAEYPQVAFDPWGNAVAVWDQFDGTLGYYKIWSNRYNAATGIWGTTATIGNNTGTALFPQIAFDSSGNAVAVWTENQGPWKIWSNRYTAATGWGTPTMIGDNGGGPAPQVAVAASGNAMAVWHQIDTTKGGYYTIWSNRYTTATGWGTPATIGNNARDAGYPQVAFDPSGNAVALWHQLDGALGYYTIWSNRYSAATGWGTAITIGNNAGDAGYPQVAVDPSGNAVALWHQLDGTRGYYTIWSNRYTAATGWGTPATIGNNAGGAGYPQVAVDPSGNAVAVWQQQEGTLWNIWLNHYTAATGLWGTPVTIGNNAVDARASQVAVDPSGNAVAVWEQNDGTGYKIWSNIYR